MKKTILSALMCAALMLCSCGSAGPAETENVPAGETSAQEASTSQETSSAAEKTENESTALPSSAEASSEAAGQSTESMIPDRPDVGEVILSLPDFSELSQEEINEFWENGGFEKCGAYALADYLQDAAFYEDGVELKESVLQGIDTSEWEEPGLHHPDYSEIIAEFDKEMDAMETMDWEDFEESEEETLDAPLIGGDSVKESYAALLPESFLKSAMAMEADGSYIISGTAEESVYKEIVKNAKAAGYTNDAMEMDMGGTMIYSAANSRNEAFNATYSSGYVTVLFSE